MLTGLLFAIRDAIDRPGLVAGLPYGGATLIEAQVRQLLSAGATQIVVIAPTLTPDLMGALGRIGQRQAMIDVTRSPGEARGKINPLARILLLADGLVASDATIAALANEQGEALLMTPDAGLASMFERVGGGLAWAGVALIDPKRLDEAAALPADFDPQSTLLRLAEAARATPILLTAAALEAGHGIELDAQALQARGRRIVAAAIADQPGWFSALIVARVARVAMPLLDRRSAPVPALLSGGLAVGVLGLIGILATWSRTGLVAIVLASIALSISVALADGQNNVGQAMLGRRAIDGATAAAALGLGLGIFAAGRGPSGVVMAGTLVAVATLAERATGGARGWWGCAPAYLIVLTMGTLIGLPFTGLVAATSYAAVTAAAGIEDLRTRLASL